METSRLVDQNQTNLLNGADTMGHRLPKDLRKELEAFFGADFSSVRIHEKRLHGEMGCKAFTCGEHIYMETGYSNGTARINLPLLAHELTHVIQQVLDQKKTYRGKGN